MVPVQVIAFMLDMDRALRPIEEKQPMKHVLRLICTAGLLAVLAGSASAHPGHGRIDRREARHELRFRHAMRHGEITRAEALRLRMIHRHIARMERRAFADRYLSPRERVRIHRGLIHESRMLRRFSHNDRSL